MENLNFEVLQILIFLLPGFISSIILNTLIAQKKKEIFDQIIEALFFSMIIYTFVAVIVQRSPISLELTEINQTKHYYLLYGKTSFLLLLGLSLILPIIGCLFYTHDWHMKLAREFHITKRTSRTTVWADVFIDKKCHVIINFEDGRRIYGWPQYYSDDPDEQYIFLHKPAWIKKDQFVDIDISGILITPNQKICTIEFLKK